MQSPPLLTQGFPAHNRQFWLKCARAVDAARAAARTAEIWLSPGEPGDGGRRDPGYLLDDTANGMVARRCNLSSWYVEPRFRTYAPMLVSHAVRHKDVTYTNVSSAPHTRPTIEAQGFSRYSEGIFVAVPALQGPFGGPAVEVFDVRHKPQVDFDPWDLEILQRHAAYGCISLWCATSERAYPFVFRRRLVKRFVPCAQLIYCGDVGDFVRFAGPVGRALMRYGRPLVLIDANGPIPGLLGWFGQGKMPKYFKGPHRPRLGDLAYTEYALLGV